MNARFKEILEWVRDEIPELLGLDDLDEDTDPDTSLGIACQMFSKASLLLSPQPSAYPAEFEPVMVELNRIAPEQGWNWEPDHDDPLGSPGYLAASSGGTEVHVEVKACSLSKRVRYEWTVITIGPCGGAHDDPPPSVDEAFTSTSALDVARRAAIEDYTLTTTYA